MTLISVSCLFCNKTITKTLSSYNAGLKRKGKFYCNLSCATRGNPNLLEVRKRNARIFLKGYKRQPDEYSPYRRYLSMANFKNKVSKKWKEPITEDNKLSLKYLKDIWENQKGICPYTRLPMQLPRDSNQWSLTASHTKASLDRIDPSKGYFVGNVEFVCLSANFAKNNFSRENTLLFFNKIREIPTNNDNLEEPSLNYLLGRTHRLAIKRGILFSLTLNDLKYKWDEQKATCPYTQIKMSSLSGWKSRGLKNIYQPSLDRIDSSKGYTLDNVEFVCFGANLAKFTFSKESTVDFFNSVRNAQPNIPLDETSKVN